MQNNVTRRMFCGMTVVLFAGVILWLSGCGKTPWAGEKKYTPPVATVQVPYGSMVLAALQQATLITTRQTAYGTEIVGVGGQVARKGTSQDDGFVVLVDGVPPGGALDQSHLFVTGTHTIDVRHVPYGVDGRNGTSILTVTTNVQ